MVDNQVFQIRALEDFLKVPAEHLEDCLTDFATWLGMIRGARTIKWASPKTAMFAWTNDGKPGVKKFSIHAPDGSLIARVNPGEFVEFAVAMEEGMDAADPKTKGGA